jgi:dUTP pyrophosphatase
MTELENLKKDVENLKKELNTVTELTWVKLSDTAIYPTKGTDRSAGYDLYADIKNEMKRTEDLKFIIEPGKRKLVPTNMGLILPPGSYGRVAPRSSLAYKHSVDVCAGVIDEDYRKPIGVILHNNGENNFIIEHGDRIAQLIVEKCFTDLKVNNVDEATAKLIPAWTDTTRIGGFGSTGK